jgi:2-polyprenyl-6-methoxyphenol hydroxylase-like FAD-dependent oxidoreductase
MSTATHRVGIIGAGTSGAYLARLLIQQGFEVTLFEKASYPRTEGCGIFLVQSGMQVLNQGDPEICRQIMQGGAAVQQFEFRNLRGDVMSAEPVNYQEHELPGMLVHRKVILEALLDTLPAECLHCNADLAEIAQTKDGVTAHFKDGSQWQGDILVGADGISSPAREFVVPNVEPCYLGDLVWRGIVADERFCPDGNFIVYARGRGIYANFFDLGNGITHWGFFVEQAQERDEQGKLVPPKPTIPAQELAKLPSDARAMIEATPCDRIVTRYSYDIDPLPRLHQGRVVLVGDAAHAKSSTRARGMTSGFEDALSLTQHLAATSDASAALAAFEAERLPIVHEYQRTSREMSQKIGRRTKRAA